MHWYKVCHVTSRHLLSSSLDIFVYLTSKRLSSTLTQVNTCSSKESFWVQTMANKKKTHNHKKFCLLGCDAV
jgi:hypothetical protein